MKINNTVKKILIVVVIILSTGLTATTVKLISMDKRIEHQDTPKVVDKDVEKVIEEVKEDVIVDPPKKEDPVVNTPKDEEIVEEDEPDKDEKPDKEDKKDKKDKQDKQDKEDKKDKNDKKDKKDKKDKPPKKDKPDKPNDQAIVKSKYISKDEATEIGLNKVGVGAKLIKIKSDLEDNPPKYELQIILGDYEYELEIHAITGAVIDFEKEEIDD